MLMAAALAAHSQKTVLKPTTRQVVLELAHNMPWQKTTRLTQLREEIQANTALPVDTTVSVRAYAAYGQARHQTSCPVVEVPSNASLRDLITFGLTVLQEPEVYTQNTISISLLKYLTWFSRHEELIQPPPEYEQDDTLISGVSGSHTKGEWIMCKHRFG